MTVTDLNVYRASKRRAITEVFSLMYRGTDGECRTCRAPIQAGDKRGKNHSTGDEYCRACWPVK